MTPRHAPLTLVTAVALLLLPMSAPASAAETCEGRAATIVGTIDADDLVGTSGPDVIVGLSGDDTIHGLGGDDLICPGLGTDTVAGGSGRDTFVWNPGDGSDLLDGNGDRDVLHFGASNVSEHVTLSDDGGTLELFRDVASVQLRLPSVEDVELRMLGGADTVTAPVLGGTALQHLAVDLAGSVSSEDGSADTVLFTGTPAADAVTGRWGADSLDWTADGVEHQVLHALSATESGTPDSVRLDLGGDSGDSFTATGSADPETFTVTGASPSVLVQQSARLPFQVDGADATTVLAGGGADSLTATGALAGLTVLTMNGGGGPDLVVGGNGDDQLSGGGGADVVRGGQGADTVDLGPGADAFTWSPGDSSDTADGAGGADTLLFQGANIAENLTLDRLGDGARLTRNVAAVTLTMRQVESLVVKALGGADVATVSNLRGTGLSSVLVDLAGTLDGTAGDGAADVLHVQGTPGPDQLTLAGDSDTTTVGGLGAPVGFDHLEAGDQVTVDGLAGTDTMTASGTSGDDQLEAWADLGGVPAVQLLPAVPAVSLPSFERITLLALGGDDTVDANSDADGVPLMTVDGGPGQDGIFGGLGADVLVGGSQNDFLAGNQGDDRLDGSSGDDELDGGDGTDLAVFSTARHGVTASLSAGTATGMGSDVLHQLEGLIGSGRADRLTGSAGPDQLRGGAGNDRLRGLGGEDRLFGEADDDGLAGGAGTDQCSGGTGVDRASGCENRTGIP